MDLLKEYGIKEDPRFHRAGREAISIVLLWLANTIWTYAWGLYGAARSAAEYTFILGFPAWYFWGALGAGFVIPAIGILIATRIHDCSLDPYGKH